LFLKPSQFSAEPFWFWFAVIFSAFDFMSWFKITVKDETVTEGALKTNNGCFRERYALGDAFKGCVLFMMALTAFCLIDEKLLFASVYRIRGCYAP